MKHTIKFDKATDLEVLTRAALGQYTRVIAKATGLSQSQVQYRLHKSKAFLDRRAFREGESRFSTLIMDRIGPTINKTYRAELVPKYSEQ